MAAKESRKTGIANSPTLVTARRALGITKTYIVMAAFFSIMAIALWGNVMYVNSSTNSTSISAASNTLLNATGNSNTILGNVSQAGSGNPLLAVPLDTIPLLMIATPVVLLFVYDKNNGVLEYLLSLGMTPRDIYMRYFKAALLLVSAFFIIFIPAILAYTYVTQGAATLVAILPIPLLAVPFSLAVVSFLVISMMAISSLQKTRAGSNQPLGLVIGWAVTIPGYLVPFVFSFRIAAYADLAVAAIITLISVTFLLSSAKLIRREKFLP